MVLLTEPPDRKHLSGLLSRIPLTTLCSLLELERLSGELTIRGGDERAGHEQAARIETVGQAEQGARQGAGNEAGAGWLASGLHHPPDLPWPLPTCSP